VTSHYQVTSGRATLVADVHGAGTPVVFLHAGVCDRRMWRSQFEGVSPGFKAIAYDRRGFGETRYENEAFSEVDDLMAVIGSAAKGQPAILVGCSQGGRIALDATLRYPSGVRAVILIAPSISGAPAPIYSPDIERLMRRLAEADARGDYDQINAIKAHLWLDGPLAREGRVEGQARDLFLDMNAIALRAPPTGPNRDNAPAFQRLGEIAVPSLVIQGNLDFPHIRERSRYMATAMPNCSYQEITGTAHLPNLEQPEYITHLLTTFIDRCDRAPMFEKAR
jgi:pimeloyl-ACP methyl ester carboxylesterase